MQDSVDETGTDLLSQLCRFCAASAPECLVRTEHTNLSTEETKPVRTVGHDPMRFQPGTRCADHAQDLARRFTHFDAGTSPRPNPKNLRSRRICSCCWNATSSREIDRSRPQAMAQK